MIGHDEVTSLFLWHALEESEHKAVAFDVYRAVGGSERMRIWTMRLVNVGFVGTVVLGTILSMLRDPVVRRSPLRTLRSIRRFVRSPFVSRDLLRQIRAYNRPGFHPDDRDTSDLVERWRDELFGEQGTLRDRLPAAA
jgi:predicted metal-dependent hydrolase